MGLDVGGAQGKMAVDSDHAGDNLAEGVTETALSGLGVARKRRWEAAEHLASGALVTLLDDHTVLPEWRIFAVRLPSQRTPPRVRAFMGSLSAKLQMVPSLNSGPYCAANKTAALQHHDFIHNRVNGLTSARVARIWVKRHEAAGIVVNTAARGTRTRHRCPGKMRPPPDISGDSGCCIAVA